MTAPVPTADQPISLTAAARLLPPLRGGRPVHSATILRWILEGLRGPSGGRVKLAAVRIGGRWAVRQSALNQFFATLGGRAGDRAGQDLEAAGV